MATWTPRAQANPVVPAIASAFHRLRDEKPAGEDAPSKTGAVVGDERDEARVAGRTPPASDRVGVPLGAACQGVPEVC